MTDQDKIKLLEILRNNNILKVLFFVTEYIAERTCSIDSSDSAKIKCRNDYMGKFNGEIISQFNERM